MSDNDLINQIRMGKIPDFDNLGDSAVAEATRFDTLVARTSEVMEEIKQMPSNLVATHQQSAAEQIKAFKDLRLVIEAGTRVQLENANKHWQDIEREMSARADSLEQQAAELKAQARDILKKLDTEKSEYNSRIADIQAVNVRELDAIEQLIRSEQAKIEMLARTIGTNTTPTIQS